VGWADFFIILVLHPNSGIKETFSILLGTGIAWCNLKNSFRKLPQKYFFKLPILSWHVAGFCVLMDVPVLVLS
jgi:hypothetical protein